MHEQCGRVGSAKSLQLGELPVMALVDYLADSRLARAPCSADLEWLDESVAVERP